MRVDIKLENGRKIFFWIPNGLMMNRLSAAIMCSELKKYKMDISTDTAMAMFRQIKHFKARHRNWKLVELTSADGEIINIRF